MQTDCRGADLAHFISLIDAATQPAAAAVAAAAATGEAADGEAPAMALSRALQGALGTSYLKKLQELEEDSSVSGASGAVAGAPGGGRHTPEGLLAVFSSGLGSTAQLQAFLGSDSAAGGEDGAAWVQQVLDAALPSALWQRCSGSSLRMAWVTAGAGGDGQEHPLSAAVLPRLQALLRQRCPRATAASLVELAGPRRPAEFAGCLGLPCPAAWAATDGQLDAQDDGACWPPAAGPDGDALASLKLLLAHLEGAKGAGPREAGSTVPIRVACTYRCRQRRQAVRAAASGPVPRLPVPVPHPCS